MLLKISLLALLLLPPISAVPQPELLDVDNTIHNFLTNTNTEEKTSLAFKLGDYFWSTRNLPRAKHWYKTTLALTPVPTDSNNVVNALHLLANVYLHEAAYDSALYFCNKSFAAIKQVNNKVLLPNLYQTKGRIYLPLGDQQSAIRFFTIADSLYQTSPDEHLRAQSPYTKILLGKIFNDQFQMERAKEYFDMAYDFAKTRESNNTKAATLQTLADWHCKMKQYKTARDLYLQLLHPPLHKPTSYRTIYTYSGLGDVYLGLNKPDSALMYYRLSMHESKVKGELYQQDEIYKKIGDAYTKLRNFPLAKLYFDSTILIGKRNKNRTAAIAAYQSLADIAINQKDYEDAYKLLQLKQQLTDISLNEKNMQMSNNLYILNNIKQKDFAISTLIALDNDNRKIIRQKQTITYLLYGLVGLMAISFFIFANRLKLKRRLQNQRAITQERERIITDLHDDVGATLSSINIYSELAENMLETKQNQSKELLVKISQQGKDLSSRMSDIIWSLKPVGEGKYSLSNRLKNYSQELLAGKGIKTDFDIDSELDSRIENPLVRKNILLVAKEAMNNIAKYSGAASAFIALQQADEFVVLTIKDDGQGFDTLSPTPGNGLNNMRQRSLHVKGSCDISSSPGNGTSVQCRFPIAIISHNA